MAAWTARRAVSDVNTRIPATAAVLLITALTTACGGGSISAAQGQSIASGIRRQAALAFWQLDNAVGDAEVSTGGLGGFGRCSSTQQDSIAYAILNGMVTRHDSRQSLAQFTSVILDRFRTAGWVLKESDAGRYSATRNGLRVQLDVYQDKSGPYTALSVQSGCVAVGNVASSIVDPYSSGQSDEYQQADAAASPVPTGFSPEG
jgi:hypothetical protein